ncbi:hypothetical protein AURDEDRAFT_45530, partial [Auricularia subglabra TFB-10046 SS5]
IMFAGDFAQLPPVGGRRLYDSTVGVYTGKSKLVAAAQKEAAGKAQWLQVVDVVILRQNMRQVCSSSADDKLRTLLVNLRYKQCTQDDIDFLSSRVIGTSISSEVLTKDEYKYLSIITGHNSDRDAINSLGCTKFSRDTGQELVAFYSVDSRPSAKSSESQASKHSGLITPELRNTYWNFTHYESSNVPGILWLCRGMPVIVKKNHATECGVTNGSEGVVVDWISHTVFDGKETLDVLFIKLTAADASVQIEGLPPNVVPICSETSEIYCMLESDHKFKLRRHQVHVLPNFSMTDFASQGKNRIYNLVDLHNLYSHQGYYTALSRSAFADNTLVLQGFKPSRLRGGLDNDVKREFRDLEILDDITRLKYEGKLPPAVI